MNLLIRFSNFCHYPFPGVILFAVTAVVIVILSLLTAPIPKEELAGLTWATIGTKKKAKSVEPQVNEGVDDCKYCTDSVLSQKISTLIPTSCHRMIDKFTPSLLSVTISVTILEIGNTSATSCPRNAPRAALRVAKYLVHPFILGSLPLH